MAGREEQFRILGYTTEMPDLMGAATLLLSNRAALPPPRRSPAGFPWSFSIPSGARRSAMPTSSLRPERGEMHRGHRAQSQTQRLLEDPVRIAAMSDNARRLGRPEAAKDIASIVLDSPPRKRPSFPADARRPCASASKSNHDGKGVPLGRSQFRVPVRGRLQFPRQPQKNGPPPKPPAA